MESIHLEIDQDKLSDILYSLEWGYEREPNEQDMFSPSMGHYTKTVGYDVILTDLKMDQLPTTFIMDLTHDYWKEYKLECCNLQEWTEFLTEELNGFVGLKFKANIHVNFETPEVLFSVKVTSLIMTETKLTMTVQWTWKQSY